MLQSIRDKSQGWFTWTIIILICVTFAFWGIHNYLDGSSASNIVAKVGSVKITRQAVQQSYQHMLDRQRSLLGRSPVLDEQAQAQMKATAMRQLVTGEALLQTAKKNGFMASEEQVQELITTLPEFQESGKFSSQRLERILSNMGITYPTFAKQIADDLLLNQIKIGIAQSEFATSIEIAKIMELLSQTRDFSYAILPLSKVAQTQTVSDEDVQGYYEAHRDQFKTPEQVSIDYVVLDANELLKQLPKEDRSNGKAEQLYAEQYEQLANISYEYPDALTKVSEQLNLPVKTSALFTKQRGVDVITDAAEVRTAAFSGEVLESHYNSEVISLSPTQAIVLRVKQHALGDYLSLSSVKETIVQQLKTEKAMEQLGGIAEQIAKTSKNSTQLKKQLQTHSVGLQTKQGIARDDRSGINEVILQTAFSLPRPGGDASIKAVRLPNGDYALVELDKVINVNHRSDLNAELLSDEIARDFAQVDYELYNNSIIERSKIKLYVHSQ